MSQEFLIVQGLNGIGYGLLIFLLAAGLTLIFGMMHVISLVHGSFFMLGGYLGYSIARQTGSFWLAVLIAPLVVGAAGLVTEIVFLKRLYHRPILDQVVLTFGLSYVVADLVRATWGANELVLQPPPIFSGTTQILSSPYPIYRLFVIAVGVLVALGLWVVDRRTRIGSIVRAGVVDREMVSALGVNIGLLFSGIFAFGTALAAFGGVIAGPILSLHLGLDGEVLITGLIVVVVGGLGTLTGALWGALLIGVAVTFLTVLVPQVALVLTFLVMATVLLVRPNGLFGIRSV